MSNDLYSRYERAVDELLKRLGKDHPNYSAVLLYQLRLNENIYNTRLYGDTELRRADRIEIFEPLLTIASSVGVDLTKLTSPTTQSEPQKGNTKNGPNKRIDLFCKKTLQRLDQIQSLNSALGSSMPGRAKIIDLYGKSRLWIDIVDDLKHIQVSENLIDWLDETSTLVRTIDIYLKQCFRAIRQLLICRANTVPYTQNLNTALQHSNDACHYGKQLRKHIEQQLQPTTD